MFNFYVDLAEHDLLSDTGTTTTSRRKTKPHDGEQKYKKWTIFRKKWVLTGKQFEDFRRKKNQKNF